MKRSEAIRKLKSLKGIDLHDLAEKYGIIIEQEKGKINKGWAGQVVEHYLGLPLNSSKNPNFGSWELKTVPLKRLRNGSLAIKETMAVCMLDPFNVANTPFKKSHLLAKLKKALIVTRIVGRDYAAPTAIHSVVSLDLRGEHYEIVQEDYELVRACLLDPERGVTALTGRMGRYIQPRTKGAGHGSVSRAFYAKKDFLRLFIDLSE